MMVVHACWYGGEAVNGSSYWYTCAEHNVSWSGTSGLPDHPGFDPDFAANASSPA